MLSFLLRRLLLIVPMALLVVTVTWGLIRIAPGTFYDSEKKLPPAIEANIKKKYGLDKPWYQQYGKTIWSIVRYGDFGTSLRYEGQSVNAIIRRSLPVSAAIGILAYLLALVVGVTAGSIAALALLVLFEPFLDGQPHGQDLQRARPVGPVRQPADPLAQGLQFQAPGVPMQQADDLTLDRERSLGIVKRDGMRRTRAAVRREHASHQPASWMNQT